MNICNDGHFEVVYGKSHCPACDLVAQLKEAEAEILDEIKKAEALEERLAELCEKLEKTERQLSTILSAYQDGKDSF